MERIATLRHKQVINVRDGFKLGTVGDVLIDVKCGRVTALVVPERSCMFGIFGGDREYVIDWCCITRIGSEVILIDADVRELLKTCEV